MEAGEKTTLKNRPHTSIFTFNALITVSMCVFTASCENSELASVHMLSSAR